MYTRQITIDEAIELLPDNKNVHTYEHGACGGKFISTKNIVDIIMKNEKLYIPEFRLNTLHGIYIRSMDLYIETDRNELQKMY